MQQDNSSPDRYVARTLAGYLASVTVGTLVFVLSAMLSRVTNFESATNNSLWVKMTHLTIMTTLMFAVSWFVAIAVTALPCAVLS